MHWAEVIAVARAAAQPAAVVTLAAVTLYMCGAVPLLFAFMTAFTLAMPPSSPSPTPLNALPRASPLPVEPEPEPLRPILPFGFALT